MNRPSFPSFRDLASLALVALAACGGGGSSGDPSAGPVPTVTLTAPLDRFPSLTGTVSVTATAGDDVAVTGVEFQIDGATIAVDTSAPYAVSLATNLYTSGQHVVRARASDGEGNVSAWSTAMVRFQGNVAQPSGFTRDEAWITGLGGSTAFAQAPDGRIFVTQQLGSILVIKGGAVLPTPFATIPVDTADERGVLGIALHPDFASNGFVYVYSTHVDGGGSHNRISRFTAAGDVAAAGSEVVLVDLPRLSDTIHNGGALHFGNDGKLYVGVGDSGDGLLAQDVSSPFGKLLRFNEDGTIPTDNPFYATQSGLGRAVWALGLRNPFTFAVQPGSGTIYVNDVGQDAWEEVNVGAAGANFGWPYSEGLVSIVPGFAFTAPLLTYPHTEPNPPGSGPGGFIVGSAVTGGTFYPASGAFPASYRDQYYFADFIERFVGRIDAANGNAVYTFALLTDQPVDLLAGIDGALYVLTRGGITRISAS